VPDALDGPGWAAGSRPDADDDAPGRSRADPEPPAGKRPDDDPPALDAPLVTGPSWRSRSALTTVPVSFRSMLATAAAIVGLVGLVTPGLLLARLLRARAPLEAGLLLGHVVLVLVVLLLDGLGAPLRAATVLPALLLVSAGLGLAVRRSGADRGGPLLPPGGRRAWGLAGGVAALFLVRVALQPLSGVDVCFRWGWLGERLLEQRSLDFYPPTTPAHFRLYPSPEATPPLVQLALWLPWACAGEVLPRVSAVLVLLQWGALSSLAARLAAHLAPERSEAAAGGAVVLLALCPLLLRMVGIGQEAGLTALALALAAYAVLTAEGPDELRAFGLAGLAAGAGALTREYGLAFCVCALAMAAVRGASRQALAALVAGSLVAAPWLLRAWWRTGNPFYDFDLFGLFPVNPIHLAMAREWREQLHLTPAHLAPAGAELAVLAALPLLFGAVGLAAGRARLLALPAAMTAGLFLWAVPNADGGAVYTLRVLSAALVLLAAAGGPALATAAAAVEARGRATRLLGLGALVVFAGHTGAWLLAFPKRLESVRLEEWPGHLVATRPLLTPPALRLPSALQGVVPPGARFVSQSVYAQVAFHDTAWEVVPIWSPEVRFLFEEELPWPVALARLRALGIVGHVHMSSGTPDGWLVTRPFFLDAREHARLVAEVPTLAVIVFED
jgi:hypothetical protein